MLRDVGHLGQIQPSGSQECTRHGLHIESSFEVAPAGCSLGMAEIGNILAFFVTELLDLKGGDTMKSQAISCNQDAEKNYNQL